jgi:hypothetical protein
VNVEPIIINQFIEFSRSCMPAKYQKRFKGALSIWMSKLSEKDKADLATKLMETRKTKHKNWYPLAEDLFNTFVKQEAARG